MGKNIYYLDKQGLEKKQLEYQEVKEKIEANKIALEEARAQGDLSENADYDAARKEQAELDALRKQLEDILKNYELINVVDDGIVALGKYVDCVYLDTNTKYTLKILGRVDSDPAKCVISNECPLGEAIIGHKKGDIVTYTSDTDKEWKIEILDVRVTE